MSRSYDAIRPGWTWGPVMGATNTAIVDQLPRVADGSVTLPGVLATAEKATITQMEQRGLKVAAP